MKLKILFALLLFALQTPVHAIDGTPLSDNEKHYVRSMSRMMLVLFMCPTGNYLIPPQMIQALADKIGSSPDRTKKIRDAIGAEVKKAGQQPDAASTDPEVSSIFDRVMSDWRVDRSDDHRASCKAAGDIMVDDGIAIKGTY